MKTKEKTNLIHEKVLDFDQLRAIKDGSGYDCYTGCYVFRNGDFYTTCEGETCGDTKQEAEERLANIYEYLYPEWNWTADCPYC